MQFIDSLSNFERYDYCKKVIKKPFSKNLVMSAEDEERFKSSNKR